MQKAWPFQPKFQMNIFGVTILQVKQKTKVWKIGLGTKKGGPIV